MKDKDVKLLFEHKFWLQILGDHSRFIYTSLSPKQKNEINEARYFIELFDKLLAIARTVRNEKDIRV